MGKRAAVAAATVLASLLFSLPTQAAGIVIDHTCTDIHQVPECWIEQAKANLHIAYQHTSHGSQLITGMNALKNYPQFGNRYDWDDSGTRPAALDLDDYGIPGCPDLSQGDSIDGNGVTPWVTATRNLLDNPANIHINVIIWSWCSIRGHNIQRYLDNMELLISEYGAGGCKPRAQQHPVRFVFMTGHAEGLGESGIIFQANEQIRAHCRAHQRILFDFADIESRDPDGVYYYDRPMWDDLDYTRSAGRDGNWGREWCSAHSGSELEKLTTGSGVVEYGGCGNCAHSGVAAQGETINCVLKGRAVWWLAAQLAGWKVRGDVNADGSISLDDAILGLQVTSGMPPAGTAFPSADVNGDHKIGLPEVIYILQHESGQRP